MHRKVFERLRRYVARWRGFNRNVRLAFAASALAGVGQGIFRVAFNLYVLQVGIHPAVLGTILSAGPIAYAVGSIPSGFVAEKIGYRRMLLMIYSCAGLAQLAQVATGRIAFIYVASFLAGLAFSGDFVVRLPFISENTSDADRNHAFSAGNILSGLSLSIGSLIAGFGPNLLRGIAPELALAYRYTLWIGGGLTLCAMLPIWFIRSQPARRSVKISLKPYLWGMDRFTRELALIELCIGVSIGLVIPFQNLYFIYRLGTSREFFGSVSALSILPTTLAIALGPAFAHAATAVTAFGSMRLLMTLALAIMAWTSQRWLGSIGFWVHRALFSAGQPLAFAFAMQESTPRSKVAAAAWLNVTFWLGQAMAAPVAGWYIARSDYSGTFTIAIVGVLIAGVLSFMWFGPMEKRNTGEAG